MFDCSKNKDGVRVLDADPSIYCDVVSNTGLRSEHPSVRVSESRSEVLVEPECVLFCLRCDDRLWKANCGLSGCMATVLSSWLG